MTGLCGHDAGIGGHDRSEYPVTDSISNYRDGQPLEGLVVRQENSDWCMARAKLVRPDFTQSMEHHWRRRAIEWNRVLPR